MINTKILTCLMTACALLPTQSLANDKSTRMEVGLNGSEIGDLGDSFGLEASYFLTSNLRGRLSYSKFSYENNRNVGSISFVETVDQDNAKLSIDWFPAISWIPQQGFFTSLGVTNLGDPASLAATANASLNYTIGGVAYSGAQLGNITGTVETETTLPYVGIGYKYDFGNRKGKGAYIQAEVGTIFGLKTQLKLSSDNPNNLANLNTYLQAYADTQNDKFEDSYTLYGLSVGYRF